MTLTTRRGIAALTALLMVAAAVLLAPSADAAKKKKPKKPKFKVSATVSASTVKTSHSFTISGRVTKPKAAKKPVRVQKRTGSSWSTVATAKLSKRSTYSVKLNAGKSAGTFTYRVLKPKSKKARKGVSKAVSVRVVTWGTVKAWGADYYGMLGNGGSDTSSATPVNVAGLTEVVEVAGNHNGETTYARTFDGSVWAWGYNNDGQLGIGTTGGSRSTPVKIAGLTGVKQLAPMAAAGAALKNDGTVWTWGSDSYGQLGNGGANVDTNRPAKVPGLTGVTQLAGNYQSIYALKNDGTVWAWGYGDNYDLGQGADSSDSAVPVKVLNLPGGIKQIAAVGDTGYALAPSGRVWAWGYNGNGELGNGSSGVSTGTAAAVVDLTSVRSIHSGPFDTPYAVRTDGTVRAWGLGSAGQLGNGSFDSSDVPVSVLKLRNPKALAGTDATGLALAADGTVWAWGHQDLLGRPAVNDVAVPEAIAGLSGATAIAGGYQTAYAVIG